MINQEPCNKLLKAASIAVFGLVTLENLGVDARASAADMADYPAIEQAFKDAKANWYWKSYDFTSEDGYELTMFRITGKRATRKMKAK